MPRLRPYGHWAKTKPPRGTPINWAHPLASGLVTYIPFWEGAGPAFDIIGRVAAHGEPIPSWTSTSEGWTYLWRQPTGDMYFAPNAVLPTDTQFTVAVRAQLLPSWPSGGTLDLVYSYGSANAEAYQLQYDTNNQYFLGYLQTNSNNYQIHGPFTHAQVEQPFTAAMSVVVEPSGTNGIRVYANGQRVATNPLYANSMLTTTTDPVGVGYQWWGYIYWVGVWRRALMDDEHAWIHAEPYALFDPPQRFWSLAKPSAPIVTEERLAPAQPMRQTPWTVTLWM